MTINKADLIKKFRTSDKDTGSSFVQIAVFTERINNLTNHLNSFKKDNSCRIGLVKMIGKRRKLMNYLKKKNEDGYRSLIKGLKIRG